MSRFDTVLVVDWSAGKRAGPTPRKDAIWLGQTRDGISAAPQYFRSRQEAEAAIAAILTQENAAGRRVLCGFDFPFGYPAGFGRALVGADDPFAVWDWFAARITDCADGANNRYDVAAAINASHSGAGPFWGKPHKDRWPDIPYRKDGIVYDTFSERRVCDDVASASSSCFQLAFPPTVGGQMMMGLPMLARLRQIAGVRVWPFEAWHEAPVVLAEIWPGVIEAAVKAALLGGADDIRDAAQVRLLADAIGRLPAAELTRHMADVPEQAAIEGWILGAGLGPELNAAAAAPPPLRNDCFALPQGVHWTPVAQALDMLRGKLTAVTAVQSVALAQACGRIAAQEVRAVRANPPLPNTAVDGYGFAGAKAEGLHHMPLMAGRAAAGDAPVVVPAGHAIRILTGAALPRGIDSVVLQEDVNVQDGRISFYGPIKQGANCRAAGEDVQAGAVVLSAGRVITPADLALLSATGRSDIAVRARLRVGVLSTGDELVEAGMPAAQGQIYDANRPMLAGVLAQLGHEVIDLGRAPDDRAALARTLDAAAAQVDVIVTSGGASAGDEDHVSALLHEAGAMALWRIAMKPGRPLALGMWDGVPVFGLPGNPVAALVCALVFAAPALAQLAGAQWRTPQGFDVPAGFSKRKKEGRSEYLRARIRDGKVEVFASEGSGRISGLSWAEGLVELPQEAQDIAVGDLVRFVPFASYIA